MSPFLRPHSVVLIVEPMHNNKKHRAGTYVKPSKTWQHFMKKKRKNFSCLVIPNRAFCVGQSYLELTVLKSFVGGSKNYVIKKPLSFYVL